MKEDLVRDYERVDDLQINGLKLIQDPEGFCFGVDAVLLANFLEIKRRAKVVDLGTGTGVIPLIIAGKSSATRIDGVEIQEEVAQMATRSVKYNGLEDRVHIINADLNDATKVLEPNSYDVVTSNPPYMPNHKGLKNDNDKKTISRHEVKCSLEDVIRVASKLLKQHGHFYMVHRPQRLVDIVCLCRDYGLEPKKLQFIHPNKSKKPNIILIKCIKSAKPELKLVDPLYVYNEEDGQYSDQLKGIYAKTSVETMQRQK